MFKLLTDQLISIQQLVRIVQTNVQALNQESATTNIMPKPVAKLAKLSFKIHLMPTASTATKEPTVQTWYLKSVTFPPGTVAKPVPPTSALLKPITAALSRKQMQIFHPQQHLNW